MRKLIVSTLVTLDGGGPGPGRLRETAQEAGPVHTSPKKPHESRTRT
jgi:hypothetical protein